MLVDYALTVVPLLLAVTVLAQRPWTILALLAAGTAGLSLSKEKPIVKGERDEGRRRRELREDDTSDEEDDEQEELIPEAEPRSPTDDKSEARGLPSSYVH